MNSPSPFTKIVVPVVILLLSGCTNKEAKTDTKRSEAEATARAEAAKKEMEALPAAFKSGYNRKLESPAEVGRGETKETSAGAK